MGLVIVDGYNVIFAWPELRALAPENLELARVVLVDRLGVLAAQADTRVMVVFDAHHVQSHSASRQVHDGVEVVYTRSGLDADGTIERMVRSRLSRDSRAQITVASSDRAHTDLLRGMGALVIGAAELQERLALVNVEVTRQVHQRYPRRRGAPIWAQLDVVAIRELEQRRLNG